MNIKYLLFLLLPLAAFALDGTIQDGDIKDGAEIARSKIASGDASEIVTNGTDGYFTSLTPNQLTAILANFIGDSGAGGTKGLVPAPAAGDAAAGGFLSADGTFKVPPGLGGTWGSITGTLSDQTDLQTALDAKAPLASPNFTGTVTLPVGLTGVLKAAAGVVSAAAVNLASEVTGDLPFANVAQIANNRILGNDSGGAGDIEALTGAEATALLSNFVGDSGAGGTKGLVPAPSAGDAAAGAFLSADGTFKVPAGSGGSFTSSYQYWDGGGSYGSTNTKVWRFGNQRANVGSDITCADSAANGFSCTINDTGVYEVALCMRVDGSVNTSAGFSVNGSALTTNVQAIDYSQGLRGMCYIGPSNAENTCCVTRTMPLTATDVVRAQGDGTTWNNTQRTNFSVTKIQ